ncbi:hypothetical protein N665_0352s0027 [Sinapis alba]|nr:hypothetical protein N665_0352s0027 [Sinapis alba]
MSKSTSLVCRGEHSSQAKRRLDLEEDIIRIPDCDMSVMTERFKLTLIGRVLHLGGRSIEALISQLPRPRIWNVEGRVRGRNLGNGRFQFDFDNEKDLQAVLNRRPCHFNQWSFALERWEPFTREDFPNTIPFWVQVTGVPVHFWNDETFTEIAKALGTKMAIDSRSARIQISVNIDKPLQFERRVGFPNGDIGKVSFFYVGLHRHCFTCNMISHDENSCPELTEEQKEQKRLQRLVSNAHGSQLQLPVAGSGHDHRNNGKRPRSPSLEESRKSPPRKLHSDINHERIRGHGSSKEVRGYEADRTTKPRVGARHDVSKGSIRAYDSSYRGNNNYSQRHSTVWNRLDKTFSPPRSSDRAVDTDQHKYNAQHRSREQKRERAVLDRASNLSRGPRKPSQQEWRPREPHASNYNRAKDLRDDRVSVPRDEKGHCPVSPHVEQDMSDSQRTISVHPGNLDTSGIPRSGHLIIHRNETDEEKRRRLKGKAIRTSMEATPMSKAKDMASSALLIGRNTIIIREPPALEPLRQLAPLRQENNDSHSLPSPDIGILNLGEDGMLNDDQAKKITLTTEEEAEVDKLVSEFDGVMMDENMVENDDLMVDEPGFDAEKIDAISQLSPMQHHDKHVEVGITLNNKKQSHVSVEIAQGQGEGTKSNAGAAQHILEPPLASMVVDKGLSRRKIAKSPDLKGARASKKLLVHRGRSSPKKTRGSGTLLKPASHKVPRNEVFPSAISKKSLSLSGSVVSQKPPSKKI